MFSKKFLLSLLMFFSISNIFFASDDKANRHRSDNVMIRLSREIEREEVHYKFVSTMIIVPIVVYAAVCGSIHQINQNQTSFELRDWGSTSSDGEICPNPQYRIDSLNKPYPMSYPNESLAICSPRLDRQLHALQQKEKNKLSKLSPFEKRRQKRFGNGR